MINKNVAYILKNKKFKLDLYDFIILILNLITFFIINIMFVYIIYKRMIYVLIAFLLYFIFIICVVFVINQYLKNITFLKISSLSSKNENINYIKKYINELLNGIEIYMNNDCLYFKYNHSTNNFESKTEEFYFIFIDNKIYFNSKFVTITYYRKSKIFYKISKMLLSLENNLVLKM